MRRWVRDGAAQVSVDESRLAWWEGGTYECRAGMPRTRSMANPPAALAQAASSRRRAKPPPTARRKVLLGRHLRDGGTDDPHTCVICCSVMIATESVPLWVRCPHCHNALHSACLDRIARRGDGEFACPNCQASFPTDALDGDEWDASSVLDRLAESGEEEKESEEESEDEDEGGDSTDPDSDDALSDSDDGDPHHRPITRRQAKQGDVVLPLRSLSIEE